MSSVLFNRIALIGVGLIGSSIAHAARRANVANEIVGSARTLATIDTAVRLKILDQGFPSAADAAHEADLIILCTPVASCGAIAKEITHSIKPGAIVTDVGSVKTAIIKDCAKHIPKNAHFVPGHPVAGTEQSGPESGFAELFDGRWCILTPAEGTNRGAVEKLRAFWQALGSTVEEMTPEHHDLVLAITSHVPHLIAYNIVNTAEHLKRVTESEVIKYSASGFRDFTRIAASDPTMWRDIFLNNKDAVLHMLKRFDENLSELRQAIVADDGETLQRLFKEARTLRAGIIEAGQDTPAPDFGRHQAKKAAHQKTK